MRALPSIAAATFAAALGACSVLLNFEPEGLPCDASGGCAPGYSCRQNVCALSDGGEGCGACAGGTRCDPALRACVPTRCALRDCPVNYRCVETDGGAATCTRLVPPELGYSCASDSDCAAGGSDRVCFKGSVAVANGMVRTGACLEPCTPGAQVCESSGTTCRAFPLALDAGVANLCVPSGLLTPCATDAECRASGLVCTVFDHPAVGPISICDAPLQDAGAPGAPCGAGSDAGVLCGNGLCVPKAAASARCGELCDPGSCGGGAQCGLAEFGIQQGFPVRQVPVCLAQQTACRDCSSGGSSACGPDAPHCSLLGAAAVCLAACTPGSAQTDGGQALECAPGYACQVLSQGPRCVPAGGACP